MDALLRTTAARDRAWPARLGVAGTAVTLALASVLVQGFDYGVSNNIFHVPYVLRWDALPGFAGDAFYQTLPGFASGLLWLLRGVVSESTLPGVFLSLHVAGRIATFLALAWALQPLVPGRRARVAALVLVIAAPAMHGVSPVGEHGMLMGFFTHTELAWPFVVLCLGLATRGHIPGGALCAGLALCINTFVGLWLAWVVAALALARRAGLDRRERAAAAAAFLLAGLPVIVWTLATVLQQVPPEQAFSFRGYVRAYYPSHFLLESASGLALLNLGSMAVLATGACRHWQWHGWQRVVLALAGLLAVGAVLPYAWDHRLVFNLHLLRVDGVLVLACTLLLAAAALRWTDGASPAGYWRAGCLAFGCLSGQWPAVALALGAAAVLPGRGMRLLVALVLGASLAVGWITGAPWPAEHPEAAAALALAAFALAAARVDGGTADPGTGVAACAGLVVLLLLGRQLGDVGLTVTLLALLTAGWMMLARHLPAPGPRRRANALALLAPARAGVALLLAGTVLVGWAEHRQRTDATGPVDRDWVAMTGWFRQQALPGPVLVPLAPSGVSIDHNFQFHARVPVWVDHKQGAAVMWAPAFHDVWRPRMQEVGRLQSPGDYLEYARGQAIGVFVVERRHSPGPACPSGSTALHGNASFAACATTGGQATP